MTNQGKFQVIHRKNKHIATLFHHTTHTLQNEGRKSNILIIPVNSIFKNNLQSILYNSDQTIPSYFTRASEQQA